MNLLTAIDFAACKHKDQRRKDVGKTPYINHPIECANILAQCGVTDTDTLIAAVLHDTIEDTKTSEQEIGTTFGDKVLKIVLECSDDKSLSKVKRKKKQILHANHISSEAKLVKLADKYSNILSLRTNPPASWSKNQIDGYIYWAFAVCSKLFGVNKALDELLLAFFNTALVKDLDQTMLTQRLDDYYRIITQEPTKDEKEESTHQDRKPPHPWPIALTERLRKQALNKFLINSTNTERGDYKHLKNVLDRKISHAETTNEFPVKLAHLIIISSKAFDALGAGLPAKYCFQYSEYADNKSLEVFPDEDLEELEKQASRQTTLSQWLELFNESQMEQYGCLSKRLDEIIAIAEVGDQFPASMKVDCSTYSPRVVHALGFGISTKYNIKIHSLGTQITIHVFRAAEKKNYSL